MEALVETLPRFLGAFSLAIMDRDTLVGVRDAHIINADILGNNRLL